MAQRDFNTILHYNGKTYHKKLRKKEDKWDQLISTMVEWLERKTKQKFNSDFHVVMQGQIVFPENVANLFDHHANTFGESKQIELIVYVCVPTTKREKIVLCYVYI